MYVEVFLSPTSLLDIVWVSADVCDIDTEIT